MHEDTGNPPPNSEFDEAQQLRLRFTGGTETPTTAILEAIEKHSGIAATDLPPLSERLNPDALNDLIQQARASPDGDPLWVEFPYAGYLVTVRSDGHVIVTPRQSEAVGDKR